MAEAQVLGDRTWDPAPVATPHREVVAQVAAGQRPSEVAQAIDHPGPAEEEMPASSERQRTRPGNRRPLRETTTHVHAIHRTRGHTEHAGSVETRVADAGDAATLALFVADQLGREQRLVEVRCP